MKKYLAVFLVGNFHIKIKQTFGYLNLDYFRTPSRWLLHHYHCTGNPRNRFSWLHTTLDNCHHFLLVPHFSLAIRPKQCASTEVIERKCSSWLRGDHDHEPRPHHQQGCLQEDCQHRVRPRRHRPLQPGNHRLLHLILIGIGLRGEG